MGVFLEIDTVGTSRKHIAAYLHHFVRRFSFLMVALKMEIGRSCKGVSLKMMECLAGGSDAEVIARLKVL